MPEMTPKGAGSFFFLLIWTLPTFWAERIWILRILTFCIFWIPSLRWAGLGLAGPGLGQAWAGLGPGLGPGNLVRHAIHRTFTGRMQCTLIGHCHRHFAFLWPIEKLSENDTKRGQEDFFLQIQTLLTFWAERIWIRYFFFDFWIPNFWMSRSQISRFPEIWPGLGLGQARDSWRTLRCSSATALDDKVGEIQGSRTIP